MRLNYFGSSTIICISCAAFMMDYYMDSSDDDFTDSSSTMSTQSPRSSLASLSGSDGFDDAFDGEYGIAVPATIDCAADIWVDILWR